MSNAVFPNPVLGGGPAYSVIKAPGWATRMQRAVSGRTIRTSDYINPIWQFTLHYEVLDDGSPWGPASLFPGGVLPPGSTTDLRTIMGFFNSRAGAFDSFLLNDPTDNTAVGETLVPVPTDDTGTLYQLARALDPGGFSEWITAPNAVSAVYIGGSLTGGYTIDSATGIVTFGSSPGAAPTADFTYYFRVYFTDSLDFENFAYQLWDLKQVKLTSVVAGI